MFLFLAEELMLGHNDTIPILEAEGLYEGDIKLDQDMVRIDSILVLF